MALDALHRNESCGGHFREEYQTEEGEALRDDEHYTYVAAWEYPAKPYERYEKPVFTSESILHKEPLVFEFVTPTTRSYK
jgi:succinate dehydrogenase / fumarate reductase flavoprotein subunit